MKRPALLVSIAGLLHAVLVPGFARADDELMAQQRATSESLFADGRHLMAEGRIAQACSAFAESYRLDAAGGTIFALAFCHEQETKTASAWLEFKDALAWARRDGRQDREALALEHIASIEPRLSRIALHVKAPAQPELEIRLDGAVVAGAAWGTSIPVDPGTHTLEVTAPGKAAWSNVVTVPVASEIDREIPQLRDAAKLEPPVARETIAPPVRSGNGQRIAGYVGAGLGVAALGVGAVFGVRAAALKNRSDAFCDNTACASAGFSDYQDSRQYARIANVGLGVGLVGIAIGVLLGLTAAPRGPGLRVVPSVTAKGGGLSMRTSF